MKRNKSILIIFTILMILFSISNTAFAAININNIDDAYSGTTEFKQGSNTIAEVGSYIYTAITNVGIVLSVVVVAIIGVKYMMGSADERAEYKKTMIPYLVGAALVFGASGIAKMVINLVS